MPTVQNQDQFYLEPLKSVRGTNCWYYNHRFLGKGGNGTAFLVTSSSGDNEGMQFVLKVFHKLSSETRKAAFLEEIRVLKTCSHPAIIQVFDEGDYQIPSGTVYPFVVVEYIPITLRFALQSKKIDRLRSLRITLNILSALMHIHSHDPQLIHRDIKPENILLAESSAKLADFGLVKALQIQTEPSIEDQNADNETREEDDIFGSQYPGMPRFYRTPELVQKLNGEDVEITTKSDIYQLGTVFYEMLTGYNPQKRPDNLSDTIILDVRQIKGSQNVNINNLIANMLHDNPDERWGAEQCLKELTMIHKKYCKSLFNVTNVAY